MQKDIVRMIAGAKRHPSVQFIDAIYGPRAADLRASIASLIHGRKITKSAKESQWGNFRRALLAIFAIEATCTADADSKFNAACKALES